MTAALALEHVTLRIGGTPVLDDLCLEVQPSEVVVLVGPSGSGKTSVLRVLLGLVVPQRGAVRLAGDVATDDGRLVLPTEERGLTVIHQDLALWPHLTVAGNLEFGLVSKGIAGDERPRRIATMLERVDLTGKEQRYPSELSGGEQQRVAIARALVLEPAAVLLDEPLANLDVVRKAELITMFRELLQERDVAALYVTHDAREAVSLGGRIAVLEQGRIVQLDSARGLRERPATSFVEAFVADVPTLEG
ncbi:MAG: ABC transporter ATP-binding protein [Deltaproteobacteria bacterium]|nr:ABC transporter ATP-binding protein [Deltaproteobacteria bacterium]